MNKPTETPVEIPPGYRKDAKGHLIPESMIKPIDRSRDELVQELAKQAKAVNADLLKFKSKVFADINAFVDLSAEEYGVNVGGKKGNITLYCFNGQYKLQVQVSERMVFDERMQIAKQLIDECATEWAQGSRDELKVLLQQIFKTDQEGKINTGRVLELRRWDIKDERWVKAMQIIGESLQVIGSKEYVRFYERVGDTDQYCPINLDLAAV